MRLWILLLTAAVAVPARAQDWDRIAELVRRDRDTEALLALEETHGAKARYLRGRLLERRGELEASAEALERLEGLPGPVLADARFRRGRALALLGRCDEAESALSATTEPRRRAQLARALMAECAVRRADTPAELRAAIERLNAVITEDGARVDTFALRLHRIEALRRLGEDPRPELIRLWIERPAHPDARMVRQQLEATGGLPELSPAERLERAEIWMRRRRFTEAADELEGTPPRSLRARWLHVRGMARYRSRHAYAEAARDLQAAARAGGPTAIDDEFHAARALSRADRDRAAIRAYRHLARRHRRHHRAAQASYLAAWLEEHTGRRSARRSLERFLASRRATVRQRRDATWQLAMHDFQAGQHRRAQSLFERYAALGEGPMVAGRGWYWAGRAAHAAGRLEEATGAYRRARTIDPLHWYGLLAGQRLRALGVDEPLPLQPPLPETAPARVPLPSHVAFFHELGLWRDAIAALRAAEAEMRRAAPRGREVEALVGAYRQLGAARRLYQLGITRHAELAHEPTGGARWAWEAAYPRPFFEAVRAAAEEESIPWAQIYATMRQESGYDADAVSHADAIGLLQVLPSSGARVAERLGRGFAREQLFEPTENIRLGAAEIASVWRQMGGNQPLAIAAYNAGTARVRRWLNELGPLELDLFIERIPFNETRNYVRRVVSHFARYRYLYEGAQVSLPEGVGPGSR